MTPTTPAFRVREAIMSFDRLTKVLLALIGVALSANALALWTGPRRATADAPNVIRAQRFVVVDETGKELATLGQSPTRGATELRLRAEGEGKDGLSLSVLRGGRSLFYLGGESGYISLGTTFAVTDPANVGTFATGPHVSLFDKEGRVRAVLGSQWVSPPSFLVYLDAGAPVYGDSCAPCDR